MNNTRFLLSFIFSLTPFAVWGLWVYLEVRRWRRLKKQELALRKAWQEILEATNQLEGFRATDYCAKCGHSPDSADHIFNHIYEPPTVKNEDKN